MPSGSLPLSLGLSHYNRVASHHVRSGHIALGRITSGQVGRTTLRRVASHRVGSVTLQLEFKSPVLKPAENRKPDRIATILDRTIVAGLGGLTATRLPVHVIFRQVKRLMENWLRPVFQSDQCN